MTHLLKGKTMKKIKVLLAQKRKNYDKKSIYRTIRNIN